MQNLLLATIIVILVIVLVIAIILFSMRTVAPTSTVKTTLANTTTVPPTSTFTTIPPMNISEAAGFNTTSKTISYMSSAISSDFNNTFSISFWMYPKRIGNGINGSRYSEQIFQLSGSGGFPQVVTSWSGAGNLSVIVCSNSKDCLMSLIPFNYMNKWIFIAETLNSNNTLGIYINGKLYNNTFIPLLFNSASKKMWVSNSTSLLLSSVFPFSSNNFNVGYDGLLSDVQIYNISLSSSQIEQLYSTGVGTSLPIFTDLVAWYPLNGNLDDYSGHLYNAIAYSNVSFVPLGNLT